jgi:hypothetical protein
MQAQRGVPEVLKNDEGMPSVQGKDRGHDKDLQILM